MPEPLAINGGPPALAPGSCLPSPPTTQLDEDMVLASLRSGAHAWGTQCEALQREWAAWNGNRHCIALNSGTAALHMCLAACGLSAGDEVITPAYSWTSSATCILHHNCIPVFADIEPTWCNMDPAAAEAAITSRTRAILAVHLHGIPADMDALSAIAERHGLALIEDCCQAHGATHRGRKVGTIGRCSAFSLNQNKMLSAGEGGLFVTDSAEDCERGRSLVLFGDFRKPVPSDDFAGYGMGWMYRYNELCAAYARAQLTQLADGIAHARALFAGLRDRLAGLPGLILPTVPAWGEENAYNFMCHVDPASAGYDGPVNNLREAVVNALDAEGVPAFVWQRRILPEMAAIAARNAYGNGSPWREHASVVPYDPATFPASLYHSASYFIIGGMRRPNGKDLMNRVADATRKVFERLNEIDIDTVAGNADLSIYERGWQRHKV